MKRVALFFLALMVFSCGSETVEKPDPLLKEGQMVDILYDLAVLQAYKSSNPKGLTDNKVDSRSYIYKKYAIDSLVFAKNHQWYAANLEKYSAIQAKVADRLIKEKQKYASSIRDKAKTKSKPKTDAVKKRDSLQRASLGMPVHQ